MSGPPQITNLHTSPPQISISCPQSLFTFPPLRGRSDASRPAITTTIVNDTTIPAPPAPSPSFRSRETGRVPRGGHSPAPARRGLYVVRVGHRHPVRAHQLPRGPGGRLAHGLAKDASDGILQKKTKEFAEYLDDFLTELSESLRSGTYEPGPLLSFGIPKGTSGEVRPLHIPSIRDRVVERAVVNTITHKADLAMSPCSFAYRTGIGTDDAVDHLVRLRDAGYCYVLRTDIEGYFPNLNIEDALATLSPSPAARAPSTSSGSSPERGAPGVSGVPATAASPRAPACPRSWPTWP
jgi:RNA-directed DNA polymerase (reverse transcriptase)